MSDPSKSWVPAGHARHRTRAPKGLFFYESHDQMARDRDRWTVEAIVQKQRERA